MPILRKLSVKNLRNISSAELNLSPAFNLFCGINGSGKTSILEAVYLLAVGRSFRTHMQKPIIQDGEISAVVYGETSDGQTLGVQRSLRGPQLVHINGKKSESLAALTRFLPLQLINSETFQILEGPPRERRQFLDWGVFHVEQPFFRYWRHAKLALLNRNNLLKAGAPLAELEPWTNELVKNALHIDLLRSAYAVALGTELTELVRVLLGENFSHKFQFKYARGWGPEYSLADQLQRDIDKDRKYGFTSSGPHKADLSFQLGNFNAADVLSRGQLKLLICGLKIAQSRLLYKFTNKHCIFLVDDLPAELDAGNRKKVCALLAELQDQIFLSSIEAENLLPDLFSVRMAPEITCKVFHVEHGIINQISSTSN